MSKNNSHTSTLFHFTKKQDTLLSILRDGLKFSYCTEHINDVTTMGIPMISFCDIPLMFCGEHRSKYGLYAIGFSKRIFNELPIGCEIGSVGYFTTHQKALIDNLISLATNHDKVVGWSKQFQMMRNGKVQINYDECEWRILVFSDKTGNPIKWFWNEKDFIKWKESRDNKFLDGLNISFNASDIRYIIVNQEKNIPNVVKRILKLKSIAGKQATIVEKEILCSRIISFEQLNSDF